MDVLTVFMPQIERIGHYWVEFNIRDGFDMENPEHVCEFRGRSKSGPGG